MMDNSPVLTHCFSQPLTHTRATLLSPTQWVHHLTCRVGRSAYVCWLHNAGDDVIGIFPKWVVTNPSAEKHTTELLHTQHRHYQAITAQDKDLLTLVTYTNVSNTQTPEFECKASSTLHRSEAIAAHINHYIATQTVLKPSSPAGFTQGLMGFFGYDLTAQMTAKHNHPIDHAVPAQQPSFYIGHYDIYFKQHNSSWYLYYEPDATDLATDLINFFETTLFNPKSTTSSLQAHKPCTLDHIAPVWQKSDYTHAFDAIQDYLKAGDCYQVNLAQNFTANYTGEPVTLLTPLHEATQAPYAGYLCVGDFELLSCSPELFVKTHANGTITTKPIKGTLPRLADTQADHAQIDRLRASEKNRAENLMIVDLLRNDLSVFAETGSVAVPKLFEIESFAQVHHMVSTITAQLQPSVKPMSMVLNALPGGSITGAPKIRAIEIIHELEKQPRGAYCGSMGYINFDGSSEWNILIRSLQCWQGEMSLWAGGGITIASDCDEEYQECMDKISGILAVLQSYTTTGQSQST